MKIRKEDKRLIHNLALAGAFIAACGAVWHTLSCINATQALLAEETSFIEGASAVNKVNPEILLPARELTDNIIIKTLSTELSDSQTRLCKLQNSIWVSLPPWCLVLLAAVSGTVFGYFGVRAASAVCSIAMYACIRGLYRLIRAVDPDCPAAVLITAGAAIPAIQRDSNRVLPALIKLGALLALTLILLAVIVWQWTSIPKA